MNIRHLALVLTACLTAACDDSPTEPGEVRLSFATVISNSYSGLAEPQRLVIRNAGEWTPIWQTLHAGQSPVPLPPAIDFDREMVVLAALGARANGCFRVEITNVTLRTSSGIEIEEVEVEPGPTCNCTQAVTNPVHVVRLARVDGSATFLERRRQLSC